jgi:hypothetical protein
MIRICGDLKAHLAEEPTLSDDSEPMKEDSNLDLQNSPNVLQSELKRESAACA